MQSYFNNLKIVLEENNLLGKPRHIYNSDETGIQAEPKQRDVIAGMEYFKPQSITSPMSSTATVIDCVNALGNAVPPYFVFKGQRWNSDFLKGACTGPQRTMSETGCSNS